MAQTLDQTIGETVGGTPQAIERPTREGSPWTGLWAVVGKDMADHLTSVRMLILMLFMVCQWKLALLLTPNVSMLCICFYGIWLVQFNVNLTETIRNKVLFEIWLVRVIWFGSI